MSEDSPNQAKPRWQRQPQEPAKSRTPVPPQSPVDPAASSYLQEGIDLFNAGQHWHAHEAWEHLWLTLSGDDKRFVQGLIMAAAMLVQFDKGIWRGVENHWNNVLDRLPPHSPTKWGIDVDNLLAQLRPFGEAAQGTAKNTLAPSSVAIRRAKS